MNAPAIHVAEDDAAIARCWPVLAQLRPNFGTPTDLAVQVRRQQAGGYRLAYVEDGGEVVACAGFRVFETLFAGRMMYVDDLITAESGRSKGYGALLLNWLTQQAKADECRELHLDSGTHRHAAHRFYFRERLTVRSFHFAKPIT